jgi:Metallo-peptidase family M12B Reprolysin-like/Domain of unknown function DUF11
MKAFKWIVTGAVLCISSTLLAAESNRVIVSHYESLGRLEMRGDSLGISDGLRGAGPVTLSFDAMGKAFVLDLEPNTQLLAGLAGSSLSDGIEVYRGSLAGNPDSWARIVVFNGMPRGLVWDGNEMFSIESPDDSALQISSPAIYRLADMTILPGSMSCGADTVSGNGAAVFSRLMGELGTAMAQGPGAISEINFSAIGDYEFTSAYADDAAAEAAMLDRLSRVDGIFSQQVGVQISVPVRETHSNAADPFSDETDSSLFVEELGFYRESLSTHSNQGLTHLFTGRDLDGTTVGIAYTGALCQARFGAGLSEGSNDPNFDSLVAAHEIGHNFGAPHDGQMGSACESETDPYIMASMLNGSNQFSACSLVEMSDDIAAASCITALPAVDVRVALTPQISTVLYGAPANLVYSVTNAGSVLATTVVADFTIPNILSIDSVSSSAGSCTSVAGTASCAIGDIAGFSSATVTITTTPVTVGAGMVTATVSADVDERPGNNQESLQITVDPAVDLAVSTPAAASINLDQSTTVNANLENRSDFDATNVTLRVTLNSGLQADSASWSIGTCTVTAQQVDCQAANFASQSNSTLTFGVTGTTAGARSYSVGMTATEADLTPANNNANGVVTVVDPAATKSGGAVGLPFLCLLGLMAFLMRRRSIAA